jgi:hypothetical protein
VTNREFVRDLDLDFGTAFVPPGRHAREDEYPLVVDIDEALRLEAYWGTGPGPRIAKVAELLDALMAGQSG